MVARPHDAASRRGPAAAAAEHCATLAGGRRPPIQPLLAATTKLLSGIRLSVGRPVVSSWPTFDDHPPGMTRFSSRTSSIPAKSQMFTHHSSDFVLSWASMRSSCVTRKRRATTPKARKEANSAGLSLDTSCSARVAEIQSASRHRELQAELPSCTFRQCRIKSAPRELRQGRTR